MNDFDLKTVDAILYQSEGREGFRNGQAGHARARHADISNEEMLRRMREDGSTVKLESRHKNMPFYSAFCSRAEQTLAVQIAFNSLDLGEFYRSGEGFELNRTFDLGREFKIRLATGSGVHTIPENGLYLAIARLDSRPEKIHVITAIPKFRQFLS